MTTAPLNYKEVLQAGQELFRSQDYAGAIQTLSSIGDDDPMLFAQALAWIGRSQCRLERFDEGIDLLAKSLRIRTAPLTQYYMGESLYRMGNHDAALEFLDQAVYGDDKLTDGFILIGTLRRMLGRSEEAIKALDMALRNDPKALAARYQLAQCAYDIGDLQRATSQAYMIVQQKEDYGPIHLLLGHCTLKLCDYRQAAYEYCRSLALLEPTVEIYEGLGRAFANLKDLEQALKAFEGVLIMDPDHEVATVAAARIAERLKDEPKSILLWTSAARFPKYVKMAVQSLEKLGAPIPELSAEAEAAVGPQIEGDVPRKKGKGKGRKPTSAANLGSLASKELPRDFDAPPQLDVNALPSRAPSSSAMTAPLTQHAAGTLSLSSRQAPEKSRTKPMIVPAFVPAPELPPPSTGQRLSSAFDAVIRPYADIFASFMQKMGEPGERKPRPPAAPIRGDGSESTIAEVIAKRRHDADQVAADRDES